MRTECIHCGKKFEDWRDYAHHILEKHPDDDIRVKWANEALRPAPEEVPIPEKKKPRKARVVRKVSKYIKEKYRNADTPRDE